THWWELLKSPLVRAGLILFVSVEPFLWIVSRVEGLPVPLAMRVLLWFMYGAPGFSLTCYVGLALMTRVIFESTPSGLTRIGKNPIWTRRRRWPRDQIAALRPAGRVGDKGAYRVVLELQTSNDRKIALQSGDVTLLRYLATQLRNSLGVPAVAPRL